MNTLKAFLAVAAVALACAGAASAFDTYPDLDESASWIAMRPVTVHCLTKQETEDDINISVWGASAYVNVLDDGTPADFTVLEYGLCEEMMKLKNGQRVNTKALAWALLALTHESYHMRGGIGWMNEGAVNCKAIRHVRYFAMHLGADPSHSYSLLTAALAWYRGQPARYQSPSCALPA